MARREWMERRHAGTLTNGPAWKGASRPGGWGHVLFDGSNDYVTVPHSARLALTVFTIGAGVAPGSTTHAKRMA